MDNYAVKTIPDFKRTRLGLTVVAMIDQRRLIVSAPPPPVPVSSITRANGRSGAGDAVSGSSSCIVIHYFIAV